jgi:DNA polymerase-4
MPSRTAARLCPNAIFLPVRKELYQEYSKQVMSILREYSPLVEQLSIDEAFLDVTGADAPFIGAEDIGHSIQNRIQNEIGLPCSIGIGTNKLVAKIASDLKKPGGFVIVQPGEEKSFVAPLPVDKLQGVGPKTAEQLYSMSIHTIDELSEVPREKLLALFGKRGISLYWGSQGIDESPVRSERTIKSMSREHTFDRDINNPEEVEMKLQLLGESLGARLYELGMKGKVITIKLRYPDFSTHTYSKMQNEATDSVQKIFSESLRLLKRHWQEGKKLRLIGVKVSNLVPAWKDGSLDTSFLRRKLL